MNCEREMPVHRRWRCALLLLAVLSGGPALASEQVSSPLMPAPTATAEDFQRAERVVPSPDGLRVLNARVAPRWIAGSDAFWYRRETAEGHQFVRVDAASGERSPVFDHAAVAMSLARLTGSAVSASALPFDEIAFADGGQTLLVDIGSRRYRCAIATSNCSKQPGQEPDRGELLAPNSQYSLISSEGAIWLKRVGAARAQRLTPKGEPDFGYGVVPDAWYAAYIPRAQQAGRAPPWQAFWSPDSRHAVVTRVDQRHVAPYPYIDSAPADGSSRPKAWSPRVALIGEQPATVEWFIVDVGSKTVRPIEFPYDRLLALQADMHAIRKTWWSPDGEHLFAVAFGSHMESAFLFDITVRTGAVRTVIHEQASPRVDLNSTPYNPPNVAVLGGGAEVVWFSQRDGWGHLYLYDGRTGALKNRITAGDWLVRDILHVDETTRRVYFSAGGREAGNPYHRYLYRVNLDGTDLALLSPEPGDHPLTGPGNDLWSVDNTPGYEVVSPSGRYVVYSHSPIDRLPQTLIRRTDDGSLVAVFEKAEAPGLVEAGYRPPEEFVAKAADGVTDLWGVVYTPPSFDPSRRYPVIDAQYGSPLTSVVPRNFAEAVEASYGYGTPFALGQLGFVVVVIDARGTPFRSRDFLHQSYGRLNTMGLEDHVAVLRQLAAERPYLDLDRVGIVGRSFGGWTTIRAMLEFPAFFRVGIAGVPPAAMHNMGTDFHWTAFQGRPVYADGSDSMRHPAEVPDNYRIGDSLRQAERLQGQLMIVMGELDENVVPGSTLQFVDALIKADRDFELLYLPGTDHAASDSAWVRRRTWKFLVDHLQPAEVPRLTRTAQVQPPG